MLFATRDIDEAILLGDRVFVVTAQPGRIRKESPVPPSRPRSTGVLTSPEFVHLKRRISEEARRALTPKEPA